MGDFIAGYISTLLHRIFVNRRDRSRMNGVNAGREFSSPCAVRDLRTARPVWVHGKISGRQGAVVWEARSSGARVLMEAGDVNLISVRPPTSGEARKISSRLTIHTIEFNGGRLEVALPHADSVRFRDELNMSIV